MRDTGLADALESIDVLSKCMILHNIVSLTLKGQQGGGREAYMSRGFYIVRCIAICVLVLHVLVQYLIWEAYLSWDGATKKSRGGRHKCLGREALVTPGISIV